jgi:SPP1 family predicted phage head-tail adaptor
MTGRIAIMRTTTKVVEGRDRETTAEHYKCWCEVSDLLSSEKYEALQQSLEQTAVFKVRRCKKTDEMWMHQKEFSVIYKGETFDIFSIVPVEKGARYLLKCSRAE